MLLPGAPAYTQQKAEISLSRQPGIFYMPSHIMEKQKLIEKHAASLGVPRRVNQMDQFERRGGAQTDALLAGGVDILNTGTGNLLLLWDRTQRRRQGHRRDLGAADDADQPRRQYQVDQGFRTERTRSPVPTVKVSTQAIVLQIAAAEAFGAINGRSSTPTPLQLGHPDAYVALTNTQHEVRQSFFDPAVHLPRTEERARRACGADLARRVWAGRSARQFFTTTKFADANPKIVQAVRDAHQGSAGPDPQRHQACCRNLQGGHRRQDQRRGSADMAQEPGMMEWNLQPQGTMKFARAFGSNRHAEDHCQKPSPTITCRLRTT